jgi:hypothetical protein
MDGVDPTSRLCGLPFTTLENPAMNDYEVTYANGEVAVITAWTPEAALTIAEEDGDLYGCAGISAVSVSLLASNTADS